MYDVGFCTLRPDLVTKGKEFEFDVSSSDFSWSEGVKSLSASSSRFRFRLPPRPLPTPLPRGRPPRLPRPRVGVFIGVCDGAIKDCVEVGVDLA